MNTTNGEGQLLTIDVSGTWMILRNYEPYFEAIDKLLSYLHKTFEFNFGQTNTYVGKVSCYGIEEDNQGKYLYTKSGWLDRIIKYLDENKIKYKLNIHKRKTDAYELDLSVLNEINFRPGQRECIDAIINNEHGIIKAATGFGKSFFIPIICRLYPKAKIDIITTRKQVATAIYKACQAQNIFPGIVTSGVKNIQRRVTIYTTGSLSKSKYDADIVLCDECHEVVTKSRLPYIISYNKARMYGFTATPDTRADGAHFYLEGIFGKIIYDLSFTDAIKKSSLIIPIVVQWISVPEDDTGSRSSFSSFYLRRKFLIWKNERRNKIIAKVAKDYFAQGKQVLILVSTVEHLLNLEKLLPEFQICAASIDENKLKRYRAQGLAVDKLINSIERRYELADDFKKRKIMGVIATDIWSTGVSFDDLEVLIRADARYSSTINIQAPGRVCRIPELSDKTVGIVIDFIDRFDYALYNAAKHRFNDYKKMQWKQYSENWIELKKL